MPSSGNDIRAKLYKKTTVPSGFEFVIRKISPADILSIGGEPNLAVFLREDNRQGTISAKPVAGKPPWADKSESCSPRGGATGKPNDKFLVEKGIRFVRAVIERAVVSLKILLEPKERYENNEFYIGELPMEDAMHLFNEIQRWSGWSKQEAEKIRPLSETSDCSSTLTQSPKDIASVPANSSEQKENSLNTQLTASARKKD